MGKEQSFHAILADHLTRISAMAEWLAQMLEQL